MRNETASKSVSKGMNTIRLAYAAIMTLAKLAGSIVVIVQAAKYLWTVVLHLQKLGFPRRVLQPAYARVRTYWR